MTKRQQLRASLEAIDFVGEVVFAEESVSDVRLLSATEQLLFTETDATIVLVELDERFRGSMHEVSMHSAQPDAFDKLQVLVPPDLHNHQGFWGANGRSALRSYHITNYSEDDYVRCNLAQRAIEFVDNRWRHLIARRKDEAQRR